MSHIVEARLSIHPSMHRVRARERSDFLVLLLLSLTLARSLSLFTTDHHKINDTVPQARGRRYWGVQEFS